MSEIQDTDILAYTTQAGQTNSVQVQNMSELQDSDLFAVQRGDTVYQIRAEYVNTGGSDFETVTLAPLTGQPVYEITAITDISNIPEGAYALYDWYRYDEATGDAGKTLIVENQVSETSNVYTTTSLDQNKYIGCTVSYLGTTKSEETRSAAGEAQVPIADMHGLRFDGNRQTGLSTTPPINTTTVATVSFWIKPLDTTKSAQHIYTPLWPGTNQWAIWLATNNVITAGSESATAVDGGSLATNKWSHVVVSQNDSTCNIYVNGELKDTANDWPNGPFASGNVCQIGILNNTWVLEGYLSDFYVVDGQALPPTAFGKEFLDGLGWGPLDHLEIEENIQAPRESPYDQRSNMEQEWSATTTATGTYDNDISNVFDGDNATSVSSINTSCQIQGFDITGSTVSFGVSCASGKQVKCTVNDTEFVQTSAPSGQQVTKWIDVPFTGGTLNSIKVESIDSSNRAAFYLMKVDGRILVDGPANNSAVWSDALTVNNMNGSPASWYPGQEPIKAFDSMTPDVNGAVIDGFSGVITFAPGIPVPITDAFKWWAFSYSANSSLTDAYLELDGIRVNIGGLPGNAWVDVPEFVGKTISTVTPLTSTLISESAQQRVYLGGIMVDGEVLVDGGDQWNTSQVWSSGTDPSAWGDLVPVKNLFDGNLSTYSYAKVLGDYQTVSWDAITANSSIRVYGRGTDDSWRVIVDDNPVSVEFSGNDPSYDSWRTLNTTFPCQVTGIQSNSPGAVYAIEVDGKILVDAASFGDNGFYLPFDPAQTGVKYSTSGTNSDGTTSSDPSAIFDGNLATYYRQLDGFTLNSLSVPFEDAKGGVEVTTQMNGTTAAEQSYSVNLGSSVIADADSGFVKVSTGDGTLNSLDLVKNAGNSYAYLTAIRVNGKILVDHNNIGVDASGNGNNFHDQNFAVGGNTSQVWSNTLGEPRSTSEVATMAFDGRTDTDFVSVDIDPLVWNITLDNVETLDIQLRRTDQAISSTLTVTGDNITSTSIVNDDANKLMPITITNPGNSVGNISITSSNTAVGSPGIAMVRVNGEILIDANQQDTVLDTPMYDYAVLENGTNGNLHYSNKDATTKSFSTLQFNNTAENGYYWEVLVTGAGTGCIGFSPTKFTGNGMAADSGYNFDQLGYINFTRVNGTALPNTDPAFTEQAVEISAVPGDVFSMAVTGNNWSYWYNGDLVFNGNVITQSGDFYIWLGAGGLTGAAWAINCGQQPFVYAADNGDGTVTVDTPNNDPYASRPNMEQDWLALCDNPTTGNQGSQRVTDGNLETSCVTQAQVMTTWDFGTTFTPGVSTIRLWSASSRDYQLEGSIFLNGEDVSSYINGINDVLEWSNPIYVTDFSTFSMYRLSNDLKTRVGAIEVNGRILVDGPADNSQNWSSFVSPGGGFDVQVPANAFNGSFSGQGWGGAAGVEYLMTIPGGIPCSSIRFYCNSGGSYSPSDFLINGSQSINSSVGGTLQWTPATTVNGGTLNTIRFPVRKNNSDGWTVWAIEVDGELLVDSGDQWNTSEVWSKTGTAVATAGNIVGSLIDVFDGNYSTITSTGIGQDTADATLVLTFDPPLPSGSVQLAMRAYGGTAPPNNVLVVNSTIELGSQLNPPPGDAVRVDYVDVPGNVAVSTIAFDKIGASNYDIALQGILIDGKVLVDSNLAGGPIVCNKLFQTWLQQKTVFLKAAEERMVRLEDVLREIAVEWTLGSTYNTGDIVKFNCKVYRALTDGISALTPHTANSNTWEDLGIVCETTMLHDLIPDNWTDEQRRQALQELLDEMNATSTTDEEESY